LIVELFDQLRIIGSRLTPLVTAATVVGCPAYKGTYAAGRIPTTKFPHDCHIGITRQLGIKDCNPEPVFSIPGIRIGRSLIPGSHQDYRISGIRDSSVLNPGIKKIGTGL